MANIATTQAGVFSDVDTWVGGVVPVSTDTIDVLHNLNVDSTRTIGSATPATKSVEVAAGVTLTIDEDVAFTITSDMISVGDVVLEAGSSLLFNNAADIVYEQNPNGGDYAATYCNGTLAKPVTISSTGAGRGRMDGSTNFNGSGRIVATYTNFSLLGSETNPRAFGWFNTDVPVINPWLLQDCTIDQCLQVGFASSSSDHTTPRIGKVQFIRVKMTNSIVPDPLPHGNWRSVLVTGFLGQTCDITDCDFDETVTLQHSDGFNITGTVFRNSIYRPGGSGIFVNGFLGTFEKNIIQIPESSGPLFEWGDTVKDCYFVATDPGNNTHYNTIDGGTGVLTFEGCIWETTSTAADIEGDGIIPALPISGTQSENKILVKNCIVLPNGNGSEHVNAHGTTILTILNTSPDFHCDIINCSLFTAKFSSINIGEGNASVAGNMGIVRNNLFYGNPNEAGDKMEDIALTVDDTVDKTLVDYNAGYRVGAGTADVGSGRGYDAFPFSAGPPNILGANDLDEEDPECLDVNRRTSTWAASVTAALDRISFEDPAYTIDDLLTHVREGWEPTNELYRAAGAPADGSPDIGAVPMSGFEPPVIIANVDGKMTIADLKQGLGDGGAFIGDSHGADNLRKVLEALATSGAVHLNGGSETPTVSVIGRMVAGGETYLNGLSANLEDTGSAGTTTVTVEVNGVIKATVEIENTDANDETKQQFLSIPFLVPNGGVIVMKISTIGTAMTGLSASALLSPVNVE